MSDVLCLFTRSAVLLANGKTHLQRAVFMARRWILTGQDGFEVSLKYQHAVETPRPEDLGSSEILVQIHAAGLNFRDLPLAGSSKVSDDAGTRACFSGRIPLSRLSLSVHSI